MATSIRNAIHQATHWEDSIFVIQVFNTSAWAAVDAQTEGMNWLKWNIP